MQKYIKYLSLALVVCFLVPQIALASWYNPFSWNWNIFSGFRFSIVRPMEKSVNKSEDTNLNNSDKDTTENIKMDLEIKKPTIIDEPAKTTVPVEQNKQNSVQDCAKIKYPQFEKIATKYGVTVEPILVAGTKDLQQCGISINWKNKPADLNRCLQTKDSFLKEVDRIGAIPKSTVNFYCGEYTFGVECLTKPSVWACDNSQGKALSFGDTAMETTFKEKKCSVAKENPSLFKMTFDCPGMLDYVESLCLENKTNLKNIWACEALAYNARYVTKQKDEAMKWYKKACEKDSGRTSDCNDSKGY